MQWLQDIYAKIIESIQARRIRVKLNIADSRLEGKKSRKCQEIGVAGKISQLAKFLQAVKFLYPIKFSQIALFILQNFHHATLFMSPALFTILLFNVLTHAVPFLVFFQICPL